MAQGSAQENAGLDATDDAMMGSNAADQAVPSSSISSSTIPNGSSSSNSSSSNTSDGCNPTNRTVCYVKCRVNHIDKRYTELN